MNGATETTGPIPLFEDQSFAGYDWGSHQVAVWAAELWGLDLWSPADRRILVQRLGGWLGKLRWHTPEAPEWTPTDDEPF